MDVLISGATGLIGTALIPELEAKGVEFVGEIIDTSVCHMATFTDPDRNQLVLHKRYAPYSS